MTRFDLVAGDPRAEERRERAIELLQILPLDTSSFRVTIERFERDRSPAGIVRETLEWAAPVDSVAKFDAVVASIDPQIITEARGRK